MMNDFEQVYNKILECQNYFIHMISVKENFENIYYRKTNTHLGLFDYVFFENVVSEGFKSLLDETNQVIKIFDKLNKSIKTNYKNEIKEYTDNILAALNQTNDSFKVIKTFLDLYINYFSSASVENIVNKRDSNFESEKLKIDKHTKTIVNKLDHVNECLQLIKNICINSVTEESQREQEFNQDYLIRFNEEKSLLIKQFENEIMNLKEKYDNTFKSHILDLEGVQKSVDLLNKSVNNALKNQNDLFQKITKIELEFSEIIKEKKEQIESELELERNAISTQINTVKDQLLEDEKQIKNAHTDFINLVGQAGIYELTENYSQKAKDEEKEYKNYRSYTSWAIIAAICSTFLILMLAWAEQVFADVETNYLFLASRLTLSLMFFVLAFYLSKQAAKHYECFQENHRTFLQLAALEPFMAKMSEDEQKAIRKGLISTYFNQNADGKFAPNGEEVSWLDVKSFLEKLPEFGKNSQETNNNESSKPN